MSSLAVSSILALYEGNACPNVSGVTRQKSGNPHPDRYGSPPLQIPIHSLH
ncbi:hypothetical protein [Vacuolonema iberomarrocanum]|uniref:hypothetical protein n=1 Tax=Vacuolonema iberomarrocanum TaxID=3454632 RepID=UPI0019DAFA20|nr:hypothetical protein [filamentous cyanobacterium LEGE 07170]